MKVQGNAVSAYLYTSGTTSRSKPCILSHQYFITQAQNLIQQFSINSSDVLFCPFPIFHADATALTVVTALSVRSSSRKFWDEIRETKATVYDFMGAALAIIYKQPPRPSDREHTVRLAWGVQILSWVEDYEERFGHPIKTLYGSVEAGLPIVQQGPPVPGSCGTVMPGYELRIADCGYSSRRSSQEHTRLATSESNNAEFHVWRIFQQTLMLRFRRGRISRCTLAI